MKILNNIRRAGRYFLPALLAFGLLTACSDDDVIQTPLGTPNVTNSDQSVSSLTFTWDAVPNVSSYSCELSDPNGVQVDGLVTTSTTAHFSGLQPNTTYTLDVYAYAAIGSANTTSKVATLTATTDAIVPLEAPRELAVTVNGSTATITWQAVEGATGYGYSYMKEDAAVEGTVSKPSLTLKNLPVGSYRVSIYAIADEEDEAHSDSPASAVMFDIAREKQLLWSRKGTYSSYAYDWDSGKYEVPNGTWEATLMAYDDDSYKLAAWYGVEGYDLEFTVEGGEVKITNHTAVYDDGYGDNLYDVSTGLSDPATVSIYTDNGSSEFSGDKEGGYLFFYPVVGYDYCYASFEWSAGEEEQKITVDDLVGSYAEHTVGLDWTLDYYNGKEVDNSDNVVTITKIDDKTVSIANFYGSSQALTATVDLEKKTLTIAADQYITMPDGYEYVFGKSNDDYEEDDLFVATFDDNFTIDFSGWTTWLYYDGWGWYTQIDDTVTTLTKQ